MLQPTRAMTGESHTVSLPVARMQMFVSRTKVHLPRLTHHRHAHCVCKQATLRWKAKYESFATLPCNSKQVNHSTIVCDPVISWHQGSPAAVDITQ